MYIYLKYMLNGYIHIYIYTQNVYVSVCELVISPMVQLPMYVYICIYGDIRYARQSTFVDRITSY